MKLKQFQQYLSEQKIDLAVLVHPDINITYFTQILPSYAFLAVTKKKAVLYLTKLDQKPRIPGLKVKLITKNWEKRELQTKKIRKLGLNYSNITLSQSKRVKALFPQAKIVDFSAELTGLRREKTKPEIKKIQRAAKITDTAFKKLLACFHRKKFSTEQEIADFLELKIKEQGAELAFPTIVASAKNSAIPHHQTSSQKLKPGFLLLDFGAKYKNYCADMSRTIYLGYPNKKEKLQYELLLRAQEETIRKIQARELFSELDRSCRKWLGRSSSYFIHSLGHGVGLEVHEKPSYAPDNKEKVTLGQIFTIEPGIYFPKRYGIRIEDTVLFDGTVKVLTKSNKELIKIKFL